MSVQSPAASPYRALFSGREYRATFYADVMSVLGDQLAAVALAVLVYERSGSALLTAAGYSLVFLPWFVAGPALSALADRWPRRELTIISAVSQAVLVGCAALPG